MGLTCPSGFVPFSSYLEAVGSLNAFKNEKKKVDRGVLLGLSRPEAYFGAVLLSNIASNEKIALIWTYCDQDPEKPPAQVEWILDTVGSAYYKLGGEESPFFPLAPVFYSMLHVIHPTYLPTQLMSLGVFTAFTMFVPEIKQFTHGLSIKKAMCERIGSQEFEVFKFLRALQTKLKKTNVSEKSEVLQRGIRRLPLPMQTQLRRRLASNDTPLGWHEFVKWLNACPSLGTTKLPKGAGDTSLRGIIDARVLETKRHMDETLHFFEELERTQNTGDDENTDHLKPTQVRDILVKYGVIPVEVMHALDLMKMDTLSEGAFMLFFVPPSLWDTDPICALDMLGNFRRAMMRAMHPVSFIDDGRPHSAPAYHSDNDAMGIRETICAAFDIEGAKQCLARAKAYERERSLYHSSLDHGDYLEIPDIIHRSDDDNDSNSPVLPELCSPSRPGDILDNDSEHILDPVAHEDDHMNLGTPLDSPLIKIPTTINGVEEGAPMIQEVAIEADALLPPVEEVLLEKRIKTADSGLHTEASRQTEDTDDNCTYSGGADSVEDEEYVPDPYDEEPADALPPAEWRTPLDINIPVDQPTNNLPVTQLSPQDSALPELGSSNSPNNAGTPLTYRSTVVEPTATPKVVTGSTTGALPSSRSNNHSTECAETLPSVPSSGNACAEPSSPSNNHRCAQPVDNGSIENVSHSDAPPIPIPTPEETMPSVVPCPGPPLPALPSTMNAKEITIPKIPNTPSPKGSRPNSGCKQFVSPDSYDDAPEDKACGAIRIHSNTQSMEKEQLEEASKNMEDTPRPIDRSKKEELCRASTLTYSQNFDDVPDEEDIEDDCLENSMEPAEEENYRPHIEPVQEEIPICDNMIPSRPTSTSSAAGSGVAAHRVLRQGRCTEQIPTITSSATDEIPEEFSFVTSNIERSRTGDLPPADTVPAPGAIILKNRKNKTPTNNLERSPLILHNQKLLQSFNNNSIPDDDIIEDDPVDEPYITQDLPLIDPTPCMVANLRERHHLSVHGIEKLPPLLKGIEIGERSNRSRSTTGSGRLKNNNGKQLSSNLDNHCVVWPQQEEEEKEKGIYAHLGPQERALEHDGSLRDFNDLKTTSPIPESEHKSYVRKCSSPQRRRQLAM